MKIDLQDTRVGGFNYEFLRTISYQASAGAELGECVAACAGYLAHPFVKWMVLFFFSSPISSSSYSQMKGCKSISRIYKLLRKPSSSSA
jgi:hypothetical protein